jgi:hypothetical protein
MRRADASLAVCLIEQCRFVTDPTFSTAVSTAERPDAEGRRTLRKDVSRAGMRRAIVAIVVVASVAAAAFGLGFVSGRRVRPSPMVTRSPCPTTVVPKVLHLSLAGAVHRVLDAELAIGNNERQRRLQPVPGPSERRLEGVGLVLKRTSRRRLSTRRRGGGVGSGSLVALVLMASCTGDSRSSNSSRSSTVSLKHSGPISLPASMAESGR